MSSDYIYFLSSFTCQFYKKLKNQGRIVVTTSAWEVNIVMSRSCPRRDDLDLHTHGEKFEKKA